MPSPNGFRRVTRSEPCPICDKPDWCLVHEDGNVVCARTPSPVLFGNNGAGWVHRTDNSISEPVVSVGGGASPQPAKPVDPAPPPDFNRLQKACRASMTALKWRTLTQRLGISLQSLTELRVGWHSELLAHTFPMSDPVTGEIVGMRVRSDTGRKWAITGSRNGLFVPRTPPPTVKKRIETLYIVEGPTDLGTLLDLGQYGIGRPDCASGHNMLLQFVYKWQPSITVIMHDNDVPGSAAATNTERGARALAKVLRGQRKRVYVIKPIHSKDLRSWVSERGIDLSCLEDMVSNRLMAKG